MKEIVIKNIKLKDWKSLNLEIEFNKKKTHISGRCGIGKSSIMHAWYWLWTGYANPYTKKNANLYDDRMEVTPNTPPAIVETSFTLDGIEFSLTRKAKPVFSKDKGSDTYVKKPSDKYTILLDGIEISATEFAEWVSENICPADLLPYCLDGSFFSTLCENDKDKARNVLMSIVGNISQEDFKKDYSQVFNPVKKHTPQDIKRQAKNKIKELEGECEGIEYALNVHYKQLSENKIDGVENAEKAIEEIKEKIKQIDDKFLGNANEAQKLLTEIQNKQLLQQSNRVAYLDTQNALKTKIKGKIQDVLLANASVQKENEQKQRERQFSIIQLEQGEKDLLHIQEELKRLNDAVLKNKSQVFTDDKCAYCGQVLPEDMLDEAKKQFNENKLREYRKLISDANYNREQEERLIDCITKIKKELEQEFSPKDLIDVSELEKELKAIDDNFIPYENTDEYIAIENEIRELRDKMLKCGDLTAINRQKQDYMLELENLNRIIGSKDKVSETNSKIERLKNDLKNVGIERVKQEGIVALCDEWTSERNDIISKRINKDLNLCKIQMFETLKNGDNVDTCIITDKDGVRLSTINHSMKIRINIELQKLFDSKANICMPIFVDECSIFDSMSKPIESDRQMIYLFASDSNSICVN